MENKAVFIVVVVVAVVIGLGSCKREEPVGQSQSFAVAKAWWPVWDTFQIGVQQRENHVKGFETTFKQTEDYIFALNEFQTDKVDAATLTIYEAILAASNGVPVKIVLLLDYTIGSDGVVAKKAIKSLGDLKGKRVGVEQGTIAHFTLIKMLEMAGLEQSEVELVNLDLESLKKAFLDGKVDAVGTYEPYMSELANQGDGHIIFSSREIPRAICDVLFVKEPVTREHPDVIDHWIEAWNEALNFKESEPEKYLNALNRLSGTPVPDLKESFEGIFFTNPAENRMAFGTPDRPGYLLESLKNMEDFMIEQQVIKERLNLKDMIDFEAVQRFFKK